MLFADSRGVGVMRESCWATEEELERLRDLIALRLFDKGVGYRKIGYVLGLSHTHVRRRLDDLSDDVKRTYRREALV
jgi:hypothetical protein